MRVERREEKEAGSRARREGFGFDAGGAGVAWWGMSTPQEQNFLDYKRAEKKALEIMREMKATTPKKADIEVALLVAIFELHKGSLPPETVAAIVQGHLNQLLPFYAGKASGDA